MPTCGCSVVPGVQGCRGQLGIPALASPLPQFPTPSDKGTQTLPPHGDRGRADASTSLKRSEMEKYQSLESGYAAVRPGRNTLARGCRRGLEEDCVGTGLSCHPRAQHPGCPLGRMCSSCHSRGHRPSCRVGSWRSVMERLSIPNRALSGSLRSATCISLST